MSKSDLDIHEEMLQPFKDQFYQERPPDPRIIDPVRIRALRERILSPYSYKWRAEEANFEIAEAIFGARRSETPDRVSHLITDIMMRDQRGNTSSGRFHGREFKEYHYVTVAISSLPKYLDADGPGAGLMGKLFPGFGYDYQFRGKYQRLRLAKEDELGPWIESDYEPKMLVAAVLERLEQYPEQAPQWRRL